MQERRSYKSFNRSLKLGFHVSEEEVQKIDEMAEQYGMDRSSFLRFSVNAMINKFAVVKAA